MSNSPARSGKPVKTKLNKHFKEYTPNSDTPLHALVTQNNSYAMGKLLQRQPRPEIDKVDRNGNTPLLLAAFLDLPKCADILLRAGANYKQINVFGQNALTLATRVGSAEIIRMLLTKTKWSYFDYSEASLMPPLCVAAQVGDLNLVQFYCKLYPGPEHIKTIHGVNALTLARMLGHQEVERYFCENHPRMLKMKQSEDQEPGEGLIGHSSTFQENFDRSFF